MTVSVSGYGQVPAAANAMTGQMRGINVDAVDNTGGAQGAKERDVPSRRVPLQERRDHPCTQAHVGTTVYASDGETISRDSADGPPAGTLLEFNAADSLGRPARSP